MRAIGLLTLTTALWLCGPAQADSWLPPSTETYLSEDGKWRLTVVPRGVVNPLIYFQDKAAGRANPGAVAGGQRQPTGLMEHQVRGQWQAEWNAVLVNETGPVGAIVSPQGAAVTFDNWHSVGFGDDVVVIYDGAGRKVRALALADFLPKGYVLALPRSVSSIWWGGGHGFSADGRLLILRVVVPQKEALIGSVRPDQVEIRLDMATGRVLPLESPTWDRALIAAREVCAEVEAEQAKWYEEFKAPLTAPVKGDFGAWRNYLREAYFRVAPGADPGYPAVGFVAAGLPEADERDQRQVRELLDAAVEEEQSAIVLGSPDPARLVRLVSQVVSELKPDKLRKMHVYLAVTPELRQAAARGVEPSGVAFSAIDISAPIPQSSARLEQLQPATCEFR